MGGLHGNPSRSIPRMIAPPPEVTNSSVVTAEQWQNLAQYIHEVLWQKPATYVINAVSQSTSRSFATTSTGDTYTQPALIADASIPYIGIATGRPYSSNSTITFGISGVCSVAIAQQSRVDTFYSSSVEPIPKLVTGRTFYAQLYRVAGCVTYFLGRPT